MLFSHSNGVVDAIKSDLVQYDALFVIFVLYYYKRLIKHPLRLIF